MPSTLQSGSNKLSQSLPSAADSSYPHIERTESVLTIDCNGEVGGLAPPIRPALDSLLLLILAGSLESSIQFINVNLIQALFLRDWQGEVRGQPGTCACGVKYKDGDR